MATGVEQEEPRRRPGWGYWLVAILALTWNAFGCLDFAMTASRNPAWLASLPAPVIDWLDSAPLWSMLSWALGVWGGLAGALCLMARSSLAVPAFAASLLGLGMNQVWQLTSERPPSVTTPGNLVLSVVIWIVALSLLWYAGRGRRDGVLR